MKSLFVRIEKMNPCPCGLTREELNMHHLVGPDGVCIAVDGSGQVCNRPLGVLPHGPPGINI
jgi:hypothetical protein